MIRILKISLVTAVCLAAGWALADTPDTIIFPHSLHFEAEVDCTTCHGGIAEATEPGETFYPEMDVCADCHDIEDEDGCATCHSNVDNAGDYHRPGINAMFSHGAHAGIVEDCAGCHGDPASAHPVLPGKPDCRQCHTTAEDYADCGMCHAPGFELRPADHRAAWINHHGMEARADEASCTQCHTQTSCQECHSGDNVRPRSHDFNYAFNHALDARSGSFECATCHQDAEYCSACHVANRIVPTDHTFPGWVSGSGGGRHATEGLFDMESCIACHSAGAEEPTCASCHGR